jgi:hypothetical protein
MVILGKRITEAYQKAGESFGTESDQRIPFLQNLIRRFSRIRTELPNMSRAFIPTNELYNIAIEVIEELRLSIAVEHRKSWTKNPEIVFRAGEFDELGNPKFHVKNAKESIQAPDLSQAEELFRIEEDLVSLKRNGVPSRSRIKATQAAMQVAKLSKAQISRRKRKKYFYQRGAKQLLAMEKSIDAAVRRERRGERPKVHSTGKWYEYIR